MYLEKAADDLYFVKDDEKGIEARIRVGPLLQIKFIYGSYNEGMEYASIIEFLLAHGFHFF